MGPTEYRRSLSQILSLKYERLDNRLLSIFKRFQEKHCKEDNDCLKRKQAFFVDVKSKTLERFGISKQSYMIICLKHRLQNSRVSLKKSLEWCEIAARLKHASARNHCQANPSARGLMRRVAPVLLHVFPLAPDLSLEECSQPTQKCGLFCSLS